LRVEHRLRSGLGTWSIRSGTAQILYRYGFDCLLTTAHISKEARTKRGGGWD
jgi:hypothetical protein